LLTLKINPYPLREGPAISHFNSFVRIPALAIRQHIAPLPPLDLLGEDRLRMRVLPTEHILRSRWQPLVGAVWMTYRRSLPLFAVYTLMTRLVCWDDRWFYMEQTFTGNEGLAAIGWVKGALRTRAGVVNPQEVIEAIAPGSVSPSMPESMEDWNRLTKEKLASG